MEGIEETLRLGLSKDRTLEEALLLHISNMQYWEKFDVEFPSEEDSAINYQLLEELVDKNAYILEGYLGHKLSAGLKQSIIVHICVAIIRNRSYMTPVSVLIVCPGSKAIASYLEVQIRNYFDFHIAGVLTTEYEISQIERREMKVDLILTTIPLKTALCNPSD